MKERPILFSGPMVRAILEGRKTQTRRPVKSQPPAETRDVFTFHHPDPRTHFWAFDVGSLLDWAQPCPYGEVGDRLYVRETWQHSNHPFGPYDADCLVFYRADYLDDPQGPDGEKSPEGKYRDWRPSIHMPRAASRITLEITGVRAERLQSISESDARAEGVTIEEHHMRGYCAGAYRPPSIRAFHDLWDSLNAARGHGWDANPWVWVIEFRRIDGSEKR
ncbi:hypothetical protein LA345_00745 [Burkholderia vietnamiensis]|uniref:Phage-related protein n=1 Tax=Burkholderia vietnamiensis (strain G4 / LMG 22486) TaxID=269482 RepID=A4JMF5_BURVG|nr:conserved hypothetical protein [Burkholderia vietnamiensis G4]MCB4342459.1 hypothetical protein [Burkholderia vietnamiensis]